MNAKVHELMTETVVTIDRHALIGDARRLLEEHGIGAVPSESKRKGSKRR